MMMVVMMMMMMIMMMMMMMMMTMIIMMMISMMIMMMLIPQASDSGFVSSGRRFMMDLVTSLMNDCGLKTSLLAAIKVETKELEDGGEKETQEARLERPGDTLMTEQAVLESETNRAAELSASEEEKTAAIPLLYLIRQLLRFGECDRGPSSWGIWSTFS